MQEDSAFSATVMVANSNVRFEEMASIVKSEVHALQYAVCVLINILDRILCRELKGWEPNVRGLNIQITNRHSDEDVWVEIRPVGWPSSSVIRARFDGNDETGWLNWETYIVAPHLKLPTGERFDARFTMSPTPAWDALAFKHFGNAAAQFFSQAVKKAGFYVEE